MSGTHCVGVRVSRGGGCVCGRDSVSPCIPARVSDGVHYRRRS